MLKLLLLLFTFCFPSCINAQTDTTTTFTKEDLRMLDSMFKTDEFINLMMKDKKSYLDISVGAGNQLLSTSNNNSNAGESKPAFTLTPGVAYNHKSGLGIAFNVFFATDNGNFKPYQFAINPYYQYYGKKISAGISYTRYIFNTGSNFSPNPFKNAFYGNFIFTKIFIKPGITIGYNNGTLTDTINIITGTKKVVMKVSDFSVAPYIKHDFYFYELLSKADGLSFSPSLMLVAGQQQIKAPGLDNARLIAHPRLSNYLKNRFTSNSKFQLQSIAASIIFKYQYKNFYINPDIYLDYYLPSTTEKRFSCLFSITAGILIF